MRLAAMLLCASVLGSCGADAVTEIVLVVETDLPDASRFVVDATWSGGRVESSSADLTEQPPPRTLVLLREAGTATSVSLRVAAVDASGAALVSTRRVVTFEPDESLTLVVFLAAACATTACEAPETCGDGGACRPAEVAACEYAGRTCEGMDAGAGEDAGEPPDAGPERDAGSDAGSDAGADAGPDAGACPALCGLDGAYLPGDVLRPVACEPNPRFVLTVEGPDGRLPELAGMPGAFVASAAGPYVVTLRDTDGRCPSAVVDLEILAPKGPASPMLGTLPPLDMDARLDAAFVVSEEGAFAADTDDWYDLRAGASGDVIEAEVGRVAVVEDIPYFGPVADRDAVYRVMATPPFVGPRHTAIPIGGGNRTINALAASRTDTGPLAIACGRVTVVDAPATAPVARDLSPDYEPRAWIALGTRELPEVGAVWAGRVDEVVNRATGGGLAFASGDTVDAPADLGEIRAAVVSDAESTNDLWLCGASAVQRFVFADASWSTSTELPFASANVPLPCSDVALDATGDVWVAAGGGGLVRLAPDGSRRAVLETGTELPPGFTVDFVATATDGARRQVWIASIDARRVLVLQPGVAEP